MNIVTHYLNALSKRKAYNIATGRINVAVLHRLQEDDLPKLCEVITRLHKMAEDLIPLIDEDDQQKYAHELLLIEDIINDSDLVRWGDTEGN